LTIEEGNSSRHAAFCIHWIKYPELGVSIGIAAESRASDQDLECIGVPCSQFSIIDSEVNRVSIFHE